ncbi:MAG: AAA family ATPase [Sarcina sp.]
MEEFLDFFEDEKKPTKVFNTAGICMESKHYMVNINQKLREIVRLVQHDKYFVINRPRQYGKTTTLNKLEKILKTRYKVLKLDFEIMTSSFKSEEELCSVMRKKIIDCVEYEVKEAKNLLELSEIISEITNKEEIVLMVDEVDKISNNRLFLDFLGVLRALFLARAAEEATTFKSVILVGVHDIKNLKLKFRDGTDTRYNSPWNIAIDFKIDMSFSAEEISTMLEEYNTENNLNIDINKLSEKIYKFTSGYPFLVSRVCQIIDEDILRGSRRDWSVDDVERAIKLLINENNTLFDDLMKNLENNKELFDYIYSLLVLGVPRVYNINNPVINIGTMFGYLIKSEEGTVEVSNQIFKEVIYNYMISRADNVSMAGYNFKSNFITEDNGLDMEKVLLKFQQFMKENYSTRDKEFLERHGVLLFLAFIKPIINGVGFDYKEVQISEERRLDIVISYNQHKYIIETKIWHGEIAHKNGLEQLRNYLEIEGLDKGYLLIFNFNKGKEYIQSEYEIENKSIFEVIV